MKRGRDFVPFQITIQYPVQFGLKFDPSVTQYVKYLDFDKYVIAPTEQEINGKFKTFFSLLTPKVIRLSTDDYEKAVNVLKSGEYSITVNEKQYDPGQYVSLYDVIKPDIETSQDIIYYTYIIRDNIPVEWHKVYIYIFQNDEHKRYELKLMHDNVSMFIEEVTKLVGEEEDDIELLDLVGVAKFRYVNWFSIEQMIEKNIEKIKVIEVTK